MKWDANLYDRKHDFVSKYGEELIALLDPKSGEEILDLGCGTGDLAELIRKKGAKVTGIDSSAEMIKTAKQKYPLIDFFVRSATDFSFDKKFDAVFSNAALHWITEKEKAVQQIYNCLKPHGKLVAEFGGKGNVAMIVNALQNALTNNGFTQNAKIEAWYFPSLSEYAALLEQNGFRVIFASHFDRETLLKDEAGIKNWLRMFAVSYLQGIGDPETATILDEAEQQLKSTNFRDGKWYADYKRLRIVAVKI
jgi:trans-aconitate 2-methyltransferase